MSSKVVLTIPPSQRGVIAALHREAIPAIRAAIRASMSPARAHMKALVNSETKKSDQSTGATSRAVISKSGQSKKNRNVFYAIVGIDRNVIEDHFAKDHPATAGKTTATKQGLYSGKGLYALRSKYKRNKRAPSKSTIRTKQVFSRLKRTGMRSQLDKQRRFIRRIPNKYFHLIEKGFNHFSGVRAKAYNFVDRTIAATKEECIRIFRDRLKVAITVAILRHIGRASK